MSKSARDQRIERIIREARERDFADFEAHLLQSGAMTTIDWKNKNGSNNYAVRYVFDNGGFFPHLYITGDLGEAILKDTGKDLAWWRGATARLLYIHGKIQCATDKYAFDKDAALEDLLRHKAECDAEQYSPALFSALKQQIETGTRFMDDWLYALGEMEKDFDLSDDLEAYPDGLLAVFGEFGRVSAHRFVLWMAGLEMALEQIERGEEKE